MREVPAVAKDDEPGAGDRVGDMGGGRERDEVAVAMDHERSRRQPREGGEPVVARVEPGAAVEPLLDGARLQDIRRREVCA